jgi:hypothetical protein
MVRRSLVVQVPAHGGLVPLPSQTIKGFADRGGDLLNLVLHRACGIDELGLDLLGLALRLHLLITGDLARSGLKPTFGVFGGGFDLVLESHRSLVMG